MLKDPSVLVHGDEVDIINPPSKDTGNKSHSNPKPSSSHHHSTTPRVDVGEVRKVDGKGAIGNVKGNVTKNLGKTLALGALGATLYPLVPTLCQAITGKDFSGYPGLLLGTVTAALLGLASGHPEITVGAGSAAATHLLYSKGTGLIEKTFDVPIFRMNPEHNAQISNNAQTNNLTK